MVNGSSKMNEHDWPVHGIIKTFANGFKFWSITHLIGELYEVKLKLPPPNLPY